MPRGELREPRSNELPLRVLEANVCNRVKPTAEAVASLRAEKADLVHTQVESSAAGGFFPLRANNHWHGGVHLPPPPGSEA